MTIEENTIKYTNVLIEEFIPKLKGLEVTEVRINFEGTEEWCKPRKATMREKIKLCGVIAERQAKLQKQIDCLQKEQENYRRLRGE